MRRRFVRALSLALILSGLMASSALVSGWLVFAQGFGLSPGYSYENYCSGCWHKSNTRIFGYAAVQAYTGVWLGDSNGVRVSADTYCNSPGCTADESWSGSYPAGCGVVHNHGNGADQFYGEVVYN